MALPLTCIVSRSVASSNLAVRCPVSPPRALLAAPRAANVCWRDRENFDLGVLDPAPPPRAAACVAASAVSAATAAAAAAASAAAAVACRSFSVTAVSSVSEFAQACGVEWNVVLAWLSGAVVN